PPPTGPTPTGPASPAPIEDATIFFDSEYFRKAIGQGYKPVMYGKHAAVNIHTIRNVVEKTKKVLPEAGDVIAALVFWGCTHVETERFLRHDAIRRAESAERKCATLEREVREARKSPDCTPEAIEALRAERDALLSEWNAIVLAIGAPKHGTAVAHAAVLKARAELAERKCATLEREAREAREARKSPDAASAIDAASSLRERDFVSLIDQLIGSATTAQMNVHNYARHQKCRAEVERDRKALLDAVKRLLGSPTVEKSDDSDRAPNASAEATAPSAAQDSETRRVP
ncbi:MAG: hypothetical protein ING19_08160, partial [Azospirillum sp.]|nr:hypothetical protein [Azospirillum sp.]